MKSNLCDYNNAHILVRGDLTIKGHHVTQVALKTCAPFTKCIKKILGTTIDDTEDLDLIMSMYNLLEYISNYSETTGRLWFYSKDEATNLNVDIGNNNAFKSFNYKDKLLEDIVADDNHEILKNAAIAVPLKYVRNFWRSLEMLLISFKVELKLKWKKYCGLAAAGADNGHDNSINIIFTIKDETICPCISTKDNQNLSKFFSKGFKRSVYWN